MKRFTSATFISIARYQVTLVSENVQSLGRLAFQRDVDDF